LAYLLDTNILIHAMEGHRAVRTQMLAHDGANLMSAFSLVELQRGVFKTPAHAAVRQARLNLLVARLPVLPFDAAAAEAYGRIIALLGWAKGRDVDRMIAGHAIATASVLVTNNGAGFADIPGLVVEDWTIGPH
jgi:tRNA(fMet)-specific endonuclease VapC